MNKHSHTFRMVASAALLFSLALFASCDPDPVIEPTPSPSPLSLDGYLFVTDTKNGNVYWMNSGSGSVSTSGIVATGKNATGEIAFHAGTGFITVGSSSDGGLWYFNPMNDQPAASRITGTETLSTQYLAFTSDTVAWVTVADYTNSAQNGVYRFNPFSPGSGLTAVTATLDQDNGDGVYKYPQMVISASDGNVYVANNDILADGSGVARFSALSDPASSSVTTFASPSLTGATGLCEGSFQGVAGIFIANAGTTDWGTYETSNGGISFLPFGADDASDMVTVLGPLSFSLTRVAALSTSTLVVTGYSSTLLVDISGTLATTTEFGSYLSGCDLTVKEGIAWLSVPDYSCTANKIYAFDSSGTQVAGSPWGIMNDGGKTLAGIAFYE